MTVLDEQLDDLRLYSQIERWYKGRVINIKHLRPYRVIKDDAIAALLQRLKQPTFVTINYEDFWRVIPARAAYCVICFKLSLARKLEVPDRLRAVLRRDEFKTKRLRLGQVLSTTDTEIARYGR